MFNFKKNRELEKSLMMEIKALAGVEEFPWEDAKAISKLLASYNRNLSSFVVMQYFDVLEKYPILFDNWDDLMLKYKKLGLFPRWQVKQFD